MFVKCLGFLSAMMFVISFAHAQTGPAMTDVSKLPVIQKFEQTPGWSRIDSETAINQIVAYLKQKGEYAPVDCRFQVSNPIQVAYQPGEVRSDVENKVRREFFGKIVLLTQYGEWHDYPADAPGFKPHDPANPDWIAFLNIVAPEIASESSAMYPSAGLRKVEINGYISACGDIKLYLQARFKILPDNVTCVDSRSYETMYASDIRTNTGNSSTTQIPQDIRKVSRHVALFYYKLGYPHADGLQYQTIQLIDCAFKDETPEKEVPIDQNTGPKQPEELKKRPVEQKSGAAGDSRQSHDCPPLTKAQEKRQFRDWQKQQEEEDRKWRENERQKEIEAQKKLEDATPKYVSPDDHLPGVAIPHTEMGRTLVKSYQDHHGTPYREQPQLNADEQRLEVLKKEYEEKEKANFAELKAKYPDQISEMEKFELDPETPFDPVSVVVDVPLYPEELARLAEIFEQRNPGWMVGCRVRSYVHKNKNGTVITERTTIECLVPRFMTWYKAMGDGKDGLKLPVPVLGDVCKEVKNSCGVMTGTKTRTGIRFSKLNMFGRKGKWETRTATSTIAYKARKITDSIEITSGVKGQIICAFTKKPIAGALAVIHGKQDYAMNTDGGGGYLFNPVAMKGLERNVYGSHRYYYPNSKPFGRLKIFDVTDIGVLELEPKRVTIRGKIGETFHPRYGSGIEGIVVQVKGYPQFNAVTKADGTYEIKNVPAILTDITVSDPTHGHQDGSLHFTLDPDKDNDGLDVQIVPNLTIVRGNVHISNGRGAPKMKVQIPGHPELYAITNENGDYEIKDVPYDIPGLMVYPDPLGDYDGKSEAFDGLNRFVTNTKDIEVKYNRCDVSGQVVDLVTLEPIPGAKVWIEGAGERFSTTADENGNYEFRKIPLSSRRLHASATNKKYFPAKPLPINPQPAEGLIITDQQIRMMPKDYTTNRIVIVLTWNKKQPDLDSQLYVPGKIRLYFANHNDAALSDKIGGYLDVDDTNYGGRETTIIELDHGKSKVPGTYRFMVYQYQDVGLTFQEGGAEIDVYKDGQLWAHLTPPPGRGLLWYALSVNDRNVNNINLVRNYPEFKEYSTLSKEFADYDRKIEASEAKVTQAKQKYEATVQPLTDAKDQLDAKLKEQKQIDDNPPQNETPAQKKTRLDAEAAALLPLKKKVADAQKVHDAALAEQNHRIAEDDAYKSKVGERKEYIQQRLEILGKRLNELLNNPY